MNLYTGLSWHQTTVSCVCVSGIYGTCIKATSLSIWRSAWAWRHSPGSAFYSTSTSGGNSSRRQLSSLCCLCIFSLLVSLLSLMHTRRHTFSGVCLVYYVVYVNPQSPSLSALALVSYQIYLFLLTLVSSCCIDALLRIHTLCCCTCELTILHRIANFNLHYNKHKIVRYCVRFAGGRQGSFWHCVCSPWRACDLCFSPANRRCEPWTIDDGE